MKIHSLCVSIVLLAAIPATAKAPEKAPKACADAAASAAFAYADQEWTDAPGTQCMDLKGMEQFIKAQGLPSDLLAQAKKYPQLQSHVGDKYTFLVPVVCFNGSAPTQSEVAAALQSSATLSEDTTYDSKTGKCVASDND